MPGVRVAVNQNFVPTFVQQVVDTGFLNAGLATLGGTGIGTSAVTGGVLSIVSTTAAYYLRPSTVNAPLPAGTYRVTYTISGYVSGAISIAASANTDLSSSVDGTTRSANGTYTETITLATPGYIGLKGQGAAVINAFSVDDLTIQRVS